MSARKTEKSRSWLRGVFFNTKKISRIIQIYWKNISLDLLNYFSDISFPGVRHLDSVAYNLPKNVLNKRQLLSLRSSLTRLRWSYAAKTNRWIKTEKSIDI